MVEDSLKIRPPYIMTKLEDVIECDRNKVDPALLLPYECELEPSSVDATKIPVAFQAKKV